jgi:hypothetical protein
VIVENPPPDGPKAEPRKMHRPIVEEMPLLAEFAAFLQHVTGGPPPKSSVREAAEAVKAISEIKRLARDLSRVIASASARSSGGEGSDQESAKRFGS